VIHHFDEAGVVAKKLHIHCLLFLTGTHLWATEHRLPYGIAQVKVPHLSPSQAGQYLILLPQG